MVCDALKTVSPLEFVKSGYEFNVQVLNIEMVLGNEASDSVGGILASQVS